MDSGLISTYLTKVGTENFVFPMDVYGFDCGGSWVDLEPSRYTALTKKGTIASRGPRPRCHSLSQ